jgi:hypothetical protein
MHTVRCLAYSGPPIDGTTPDHVYVVGWRGTVANLEVWTPIVMSVTIGRALLMLNALNGGDAPADHVWWVNVMTVETATGTIQAAPETGSLHDYRRGEQWPSTEIPRPATTLKKSGPDDERRTD